MDLERTLETQRVKLLRLLAGWIALLEVLSFGPVGLPLPQWARAFFDRVLIRAELAAQFLVQAIALTQATGGLKVQAPMEAARGQQGVDVPSVQELFRRMKALRDVLEDLPQYARRLLWVGKTAGEAVDFCAPLRFAPARDPFATVGADWTLPRVERPPDKDEDRFGWLGAPLTLFPNRDRGRWRLSARIGPFGSVPSRCQPSVLRQHEAAHRMLALPPLI